ncbi:MAG: hypothetical protein QF903_11275 [Planctomycetota bacterium]|jgi:hypothetical protein|nr:hypothetical protein [Planctomycetota bacterium]MDP6763259.1 hypothetical protein [Planctomycetota bacterium]MDP6990047.1 hypothetical protein [Planctomycetota bacterium]
MAGGDGQTSSLWLTFALMTVVTWGLYGVLLHTGQAAMGDPVNGRYKAFLWVGIAYFLIAVVGPVVLLVGAKSDWAMSGGGIAWSLLAGTSGAVGAFCVLLAFGARGHPAAVMSIIFAGAPIVNALVALAIHPPAGGLASLRWQFVCGIALAALGGTLVTLYKPGPPPPAAGAGEGADEPQR